MSIRLYNFQEDPKSMHGIFILRNSKWKWVGFFLRCDGFCFRSAEWSSIIFHEDCARIARVQKYSSTVVKDTACHVYSSICVVSVSGLQHLHHRTCLLSLLQNPKGRGHRCLLVTTVTRATHFRPVCSRANGNVNLSWKNDILLNTLNTFSSQTPVADRLSSIRTTL